MAPCLIYAENTVHDEKLLLFDGCKHGYNAMFVDRFTENQINNRSADQYYSDSYGEDVFTIRITIFNNFNYDDEFAEYVDENGMIELPNGSILSFEEVKRNGYDGICIELRNSKGQQTECLSEELA